MAIMEYSSFPKALVLLKPHHQIVLCHIRTFFGRVLPHCRDAVGVFCSTSWLDHLLGESYFSAEMQLVYSATPADWATHWGSLTPLQRCSWCIMQPQLTGPFTLDNLFNFRKQAKVTLGKIWSICAELPYPVFCQKLQLKKGLCYIIKEWFFFILIIFSLIIFYDSVW